MPEHDLFYVIEGHFYLQLENEELEFEKGDVAMLPALYPHYGTKYCATNSHTIYIHFGRKDADRILLNRGGWGNRFFVVPSRVRSVSPMVSHYFYEISKTFSAKMSSWENRCGALVNLILGELNDCFVQKAGKEDEIISDLLTRQS
jgi:hypothetical protein